MVINVRIMIADTITNDKSAVVKILLKRRDNYEQ